MQGNCAVLSVAACRWVHWYSPLHGLASCLQAMLLHTHMLVRRHKLTHTQLLIMHNMEKKNIQKTGSHKRLKDVRWGPQGGKFRSGKAENNQKRKKKKGNIWKAGEFKYSLHKWWFFFNEIYYIIFQRASIENTDLSATVMIRKLLKQQKAHIQAIPVQCSWDSLYSDSLRKKNRVLYTVGDHFKTDIRAYL